MKRGTLNLAHSGPSGGKSTLIAQAIRAHFENEPFFVRGLDLPEGRVMWIQTDRGLKDYQPLLKGARIWGNPKLDTLNFVDETILHDMTYQGKEREADRIDALRQMVKTRIRDRDIGTVILDLYDEFQTGDTRNGHKMAYHGRANLRWAIQMDVALIGVCYTFKQTTMNTAKRLQDRLAGSLRGQASANWKISLVDAEELQKPYGIIEAKPGPGDGMPQRSLVVRGEPPEDCIGMFAPYTQEAIDKPMDAPMLFAIMPDTFSSTEAEQRGEQIGLSRSTVFRFLDQLIADGLVMRAERGTYRKLR
jgi:hypothetical protein